MRMTQLLGRRFKEQPAAAHTQAQALLLRGGHARICPPANYAYLTPAHQIQQNILQQLDAMAITLGSQPWSLPPTLTGTYEDELRLIANELASYSDLPCAIHTTRTVIQPNNTANTHWRMLGLTAQPKDSWAATADQRNAMTNLLKNIGFHTTHYVHTPTIPALELNAIAFYFPDPNAKHTYFASQSYKYLAEPDRVSLLPQKAHAFTRHLTKTPTPACKTINDLEKFFTIEADETAKTVLFTNPITNQLIIAMIRGDREVSQAKIANIIDCNPLPATDNDIRKAGLVPGYASAIGISPNNAQILIDHTVFEAADLIAGANEEGFHYKHFNAQRDCPGIEADDIAIAQTGDINLIEEPIFELNGTPLARAADLEQAALHQLNLTYTTKEGKHETPSAYTLTVDLDNLLQQIIQTHHDANGPIFPPSIAPWNVHICAINLDNPQVKATAEQLYATLQQNNITTLLDDRNNRPGVQFADADLIGIPWRITIGERALANNELEWKRRDTNEKGNVQKDAALELIQSWIAQNQPNPLQKTASHPATHANTRPPRA